MKHKKPQSQTVRLNPEASALVATMAEKTGQSETKIASAMIITIASEGPVMKNVVAFQGWIKRQTAFEHVKREAESAVKEARKALKGAGHS